MRKFNSVKNFLKTVADAVSARIRSNLVVLQFGSHREEHALDIHIQDFVVEPSPNLMLCVDDPIIKGYVHRHVFSDRAICRLRGATFDSDTGNIYLGKLLVRESNSDTSNLSIRRSSVVRQISDYPIIGVPCQTYYHWLIETLPRVIAAARFEPKAVLVAPTRMSKNQRDAIEMLGSQVLYSDARHSSDNLILATRAQDTGWAHPLDLDILRKTVCVPTTKGFRRIFVTRVGSRRSDSLSQFIHDFAANSGWTVIQAEDLSWEETTGIFGEAAVIAGEHGAGLANLALAPLGTHLIELERSNYANPCFAALSLSLNGNTRSYSHYPIEQYRTALDSTFGG